MASKRIKQDKSKKHGSLIFQPYRALGHVTTATPFCVQSRGKEEFVTLSVGRSFQIYDVAKFHLKFVSQPMSRDITSFAAFRDFTFVASGGRVYQFRRAKQTGVILGDESAADILQMITIEAYLLVLHEDNVIRVWDLTSSELFTELALAEGFQANCMVHPTAYVNKLLVGSQQGTMQLWNFKSRKMLFEFAGNSPVCAIEQAPVVDVVAVGRADGSVEIINIRVNKKLMSFTQETCVTGITFRSDDCPLLATSLLNGDIAIWNLEERRLVHIIKSAHHGAVSSIKFLPGRGILMSSGADNAIKQWTFDKLDGNPRLLKYRSGHQAPPSFIRFYDSEGRFILSTSSDRSLRLTCTIRDQQNIEFSQGHVESKANKLQINAADLKLPTPVQFASSTNREKDWDCILTSHVNHPKAQSWSFERKALGASTFASLDKSNVKCVTVSECGNFGLIGCASGKIELFNLQSGLHRRTYTQDGHSSPVSALAVDCSNQYVMSCSVDGTLRKWCFHSAKCLNTLSIGYPISQVQLHSGNGLLALVSDDLSIRIVDIERMAVVREFDGHENRITDITFSPDGRWIVSASIDYSIRTWDIPTGHLVDMVRVPSVCTSLCFSPTSEFLATCHSDSVGIHLWSNRTLFAPVPLRPITHDLNEIETAELPSVAGNDGEVVEVEEEREDDVFYRGQDQLTPELITLTLEPQSKWHNLLHLDTIKKRNKPKEPPKAPELAPFFLSTIPGLEPKFDVQEKPKGDTDGLESKILSFSQMEGVESEFRRRLRSCASSGDFTAFINYLKTLSPAASDLEIQSFNILEGTDDLKLFMNALQWALTTRKDFELIQSYIARTLRVHSDEFCQGEEFKQTLSEILSSQEQGWLKLDSMLQRSICVVDLLR